MEKGLIIGRNFENENKPLTDDEGKPYKEGEIGQQSEKIWDLHVSRRHLLLARNNDREYPYYIKLLNLNNVVCINNRRIDKYSKDAEKDLPIKGEEEIRLGEESYLLDIQKAIKDLNEKCLGKTIYPIGGYHGENISEPHTPSPTPQVTISSLIIYLKEKVFGITTILLLIFFIMAIITKQIPIAHNIILSLLAITLLANIYIKINKKG